MRGSQDQFDRLRLIRSPNIGPVSYRQLIARFGSARAALEALPDLVMRGGGKRVEIASAAAVEREMKAMIIQRAESRDEHAAFCKTRSQRRVTEQRRVEMGQNSPVAITVTEEGLGDLRLYRVPIPTTVAANAQKQVALFDRKLVDMAIVYAVRVDQDYDEEVELQLRTRNRKQEGLGLALPGGPVAVFEPHGGQVMLIGEGGLADKAVGEDVEIRLSEATQVQFEAVEVESGDNWDEYEYAATNANPWPITLEVLLTHDPARKLSRASAKHGRKDGWPKWLTAVPAHGEVNPRIPLTEAEEKDEEDDD